MPDEMSDANSVSDSLQPVQLPPPAHDEKVPILVMQQAKKWLGRVRFALGQAESRNWSYFAILFLVSHSFMLSYTKMSYK